MTKNKETKITNNLKLESWIKKQIFLKLKFTCNYRKKVVKEISQIQLPHAIRNMRHLKKIEQCVSKKVAIYKDTYAGN